MKSSLPLVFLSALFALRSNASDRPAQPQWTDGTKWDSGAYVYDAAGNIIAIGNDAYRYDSLLRLQTATAKTPGHDSNAQQLSYDRYGNILNVTTNGAMTSMAVDPLTNQLDGACTTGGTCIRGPYDSAGNMTALDGTANTYTWDDLGMMTARTIGGTPGTRFVYDANNERVAIITGDSTRYTLRGPDNKVVRELVDTPAAGLQWSKDYVYRGSTLLAAFTAGSPGTGPHRHYHVDHLGTPRMLTDAAGIKLALPTHWPFGREAVGSEPSDDRMKFTGHERDSAGPGAEGLDLDYMHARFYDPTEGRFLSMDPVLDLQSTVKNPQAWNRYAYVLNNPLNRIDPDGRLVRMMGNEKERQQAYAILRSTLRPQDRKHVSMDAKGVIIVNQKATGGVAFSHLKNVARTDVPTIDVHLGQAVTSKVAPIGASRLKTESLQAKGGGVTLPPRLSVSGNIEVHVDPRGSFSAQAPAMAVMAHELLGHASDMLFNPKVAMSEPDAEQSAVETENEVLRELNMQPFRQVPRP